MPRLIPGSQQFNDGTFGNLNAFYAQKQIKFNKRIQPNLLSSITANTQVDGHGYLSSDVPGTDFASVGNNSFVQNVAGTYYHEQTVLGTKFFQDSYGEIVMEPVGFSRQISKNFQVFSATNTTKDLVSDILLELSSSGAVFFTVESSQCDGLVTICNDTAFSQNVSTTDPVGVPFSTVTIPSFTVVHAFNLNKTLTII